MSEFVSQAEFARLMDWAKSYVTKLKQDGRLCIRADGKVDVAASKLMIEQTGGSSRPDVTERFAKERGAVPPGDNEEEKPTDWAGPSKADSAAKKEHFSALHAEADYRTRIGELVEAKDVAAAIADVSIVFRQTLENLPARVASELIGKDLDQVRATLKQEIYSALSDMERHFSVKLTELAPEVV
jgi:hypothetical protein